MPKFCREGAKTLPRPHKYGISRRVSAAAHKPKDEEKDLKREVLLFSVITFFYLQGRMLSRLKKKNEALSALGVDYELPVPGASPRKRKAPVEVVVVDKDEVVEVPVSVSSL